jgi:hypothetical protein
MFYLINHITLHSDHFTWKQAVHQSSLFQTVMSWCQHILFQHDAVNITFLFTIFKGPENGFHGSQPWMTFHYRIFHSTSKFYWGHQQHYILNALTSPSVQGLLLYTLSFSKGKNCIVFYLANKEARILCLIFCHQKLSNGKQNCLWCELLHCLAGKGHSFSCKQTGGQRWYQNVRNILVWINGFGGEKTDPITLVPVVAYHTPTLTSSNGTSSITIENL